MQETPGLLCPKSAKHIGKRPHGKHYDVGFGFAFEGLLLGCRWQPWQRCQRALCGSDGRATLLRLELRKGASWAAAGKPVQSRRLHRSPS